jgi:hypothetical protein
MDVITHHKLAIFNLTYRTKSRLLRRASEFGKSLEFIERSSPPKISGDSAMTIKRLYMIGLHSFCAKNSEVVSNYTPM